MVQRSVPSTALWRASILSRRRSRGTSRAALAPPGRCCDPRDQRPDHHAARAPRWPPRGIDPGVKVLDCLVGIAHQLDHVVRIAPLAPVPLDDRPDRACDQIRAVLAASNAGPLHMLVRRARQLSEFGQVAAKDP